MTILAIIKIIVLISGVEKNQDQGTRRTSSGMYKVVLEQRREP